MKNDINSTVILCEIPDIYFTFSVRARTSELLREYVFI